jgi:hypothetical protein
MKHIVVFCLLVTGVQGAIQNVSVLGTTATQALIRYTAPNNSPCNVEVSESPTFSPLVNDVDGTKFASAPSDARAGSISNGAERTFVAGRRAAEIGLDTIRYSRALQTATQHFFRVTCPSTGDKASGNFETTTIPFGSTYAEAEAGDPNLPGSYAYPTLSVNDRTQQVIDPQTGLLIKRLSLPKDVYERASGVPLQVVRASGWSNLGNLGSADGNAAIVTGSTAPLFMGLAGNAPYFNYMHPTAFAYMGPTGAFAYFQVHLIAAVNPGGSAPANPDDATITACLTKDGVNCYPGSAKYQAQLTTSLKDVPFGTTNNIDLWQAGPGTTLPNWVEQAPRSGTMYCDGSNSVFQLGGSVFPIHWGLGSIININGVDYPISRVNHTAQLTLMSPCPTMFTISGSFDQGSRTFRAATDTFQPSDAGRQIVILGAGGSVGPWYTTVGQVSDARTIITNDNPVVTGVSTQAGFPYAFSAVNFGVLVSKKTTSSDTIAVDYGSVNYDLDMYSSFVVEGGTEMCSLNTVIGPNGRPGYNCLISSIPNMYWVDAASGETHFKGLTTTVSPSYVVCGAESQNHDTKNPDTMYCLTYGSLYTTTYYGNHAEPTAIEPTGGFGFDASFRACNPGVSAPPFIKQQPCMLTQPLTPGTDLITLTAAFTQNPAYAPALDTVGFRTIAFRGLDENGDLLLTATKSGQNSLGWSIVFRPSATSNSEGGSSNGAKNNFGCVGGGIPGCVVAAMPDWARPGCRWCVVKDALTPYPGWMSVQTYGWGCCVPGAGPYYVPVVDGTANSTKNFLDGSTTLVNCPPNPYGATGMNCSTLTIGSEPLSPMNGGGEKGLPGELGNAELGDRFATQVQLPINATEQMMLIAKNPGTAAGTWIYTLWRRINIANGAGFATTGPNPSLYTVCAANQVLADQPSQNTFFWNFAADPHGMNQNGHTIPPNPTSALGHQFYTHGNYGGDFGPSTENRCAAANGACYSTILLNGRTFNDVVEAPAVTALQIINPPFGTGKADQSNVQSHPTGGGIAAPPDRFNYMFDGRPYYGGYNSGLGGNQPATLIADQLYMFPQTAMANIDLPYRKNYPTAAFSGQLPLVDISSSATGDVISTGPGDSYKYCVAAKANECRQGSALGDVYVNAPHVRYPFCFIAAQNGNLADEYDLCISGSAPIRDAITQTDMRYTDIEGHATRILTKFRRARVLNIFDTPYVLPNGQWMIFESQFAGDASLNKVFFIGKIPPPAPRDSYNRGDFIPLALKLPPLTGATQAFVRFGYAENGPGTSLFCNSRKENCVAGSQNGATPIDHTNPFYLEQTESSSWTPMACNNGCTINIPGVPQRVLYYQFVYANAGGIVYTSPVSATMVP